MENKSLFRTLTIILSIITLYAFVVVVCIPVFTKEHFPKPNSEAQIEEKTVQKEKVAKKTKIDKEISAGDTIDKNSTNNQKLSIFDLNMKEQLLRSRMLLAKEDSMYLMLDLKNNIASLELKGVVLRKCNISKFAVDNSIKKIHTENFINWFSEPFVVKNASATIPKIIFNEKIAPKDTAEANQATAQPVAQKLQDVMIIMDFERNLRLVINQEEAPDKEGRSAISSLRWKYRFEELTSSISALFRFNRELAVPQISIVIPKTDAIIFYRALPIRPKIIMKL